MKSDPFSPKLDGNKYANIITVFAVILAVEYATGSYDLWDGFIGIVSIVLGYSFIPLAKKHSDNWYSFITASLISLGLITILSMFLFFCTIFIYKDEWSKYKYTIEIIRFSLFIIIAIPIYKKIKKEHMTTHNRINTMQTATKRRYQRALQRNLHEIGRAILNRRAIIGLLNAETYHALDFIRLANWALFNDMIAHSIKTLENRKGNASFWYIYRLKEKEINGLIKENKIDIETIKNTADSLLHIRDKTHFHIDKKAVEDPKKIWREGGVSGNQLAGVLDNLFLILNSLHEKEFGKPFNFPEYDGSDATKIAKFAEEMNS